MRIIRAVGWIVLGYGNVLNLSYTACLIIVLCQIVRGVRKKSASSQKSEFWNCFFLIALLCSPFLLILISGGGLIIRSLICFPIVCCYLLYTYCERQKYARVALIILVVSQIIHGQALLYSDNLRYKNDLAIAKKIYTDCNASPDTHIVIRGVEKSEENIYLFKGECMGCSFWEWSYNGADCDIRRIKNVMTYNGMDFSLSTIEETAIMQNLHFLAEYPNDGYIIEQDGCYYVNLGD